MRTAANLHDALMLAGHASVVGVSAAIVHTEPGPGNVRLDFAADATAPQITTAQAFAAAFDWSDAAQLAADKLAYRPLAVARITLPGPLETLGRAHVSLELDEINLLRDWITQFKAAVAAATSLANLQTRVAALPNVPARTLAQYRTAMTNKINAGTEDG